MAAPLTASGDEGCRGGGAAGNDTGDGGAEVSAGRAQRSGRAGNAIVVAASIVAAVVEV